MQRKTKRTTNLKGNEMTSPTKIRQITDHAIAEATARIQRTLKTLNDGSPNPNYESAVTELAELQWHHSAKNKVVARAAKLGYRRNDYAGTCVKTGVDVKPGAGFAKKNDAGKWQVFSFQAICEKVNL